MNKLIVDFNCIIDTDYGILQVIKSKYNNDTYIDTEFLDKVDKNVLVYLLMNRIDRNPLSLVFKEEYQDQIDKILNDLISTEYGSILAESISTNIKELINTFISTGQVSVTVLCKNIQEEQIIKKINKDIKTILRKDLNNFNEYDCIYLKDINDVKSLPDLGLKTIYIAKYRFNFEDDGQTILLKDMLKLLKDTIIYTIDIYITQLNALG